MLNGTGIVVFEKNKALFYFIKGVLILLLVLMLILPFAAAGLSQETMYLSLVALPFCVVFSGLLYLVARKMHLKIIVDDDGVVFEDLSPVKIPWSEIRSLTTKRRRLHGKNASTWLVIALAEKEKYVAPRIIKLGELMFDGGVPVCNLDSYREKSDIMLETLLSKCSGQ